MTWKEFKRQIQYMDALCKDDDKVMSIQFDCRSDMLLRDDTRIHKENEIYIISGFLS